MAKTKDDVKGTDKGTELSAEKGTETHADGTTATGATGDNPTVAGSDQPDQRLTGSTAPVPKGAASQTRKDGTAIPSPDNKPHIQASGEGTPSGMPNMKQHSGLIGGGPAPFTAADLTPGARVKVRAIRDGYYDLKRYREGDVFWIDGATDNRKQLQVAGTVPPEYVDNPRYGEIAALGSWMERVDGKTPERVTTGQQVINQQHDRTLRERAGIAEPDTATGDQDVLGQ